jgi:hypothetical protein
MILKRIRPTCILPFWNALVLGSILGMHFLYLEFQNNNQGEYFDPGSGAVDFPYVTLMFSTVAIPVAVIVFITELAFHGVVRWLGIGNTTKGLRIILLPGLDAIILGLLVGGWLFYLYGDDASVLGFPSKGAALLSVIVFCVELTVQHIARSVRRAQANARANRIEP